VTFPGDGNVIRLSHT